jgi:flavodoxin
MKILVMYSSLTGNTKKVAEAIAAALSEESTLVQVADKLPIQNYDIVFLGFWIDRSSADNTMAQFMQQMHDENVALFATLGAYPNTAYAEKCMENAVALLPQDNTVLGKFHCQGKIAEKLVEKFKTLPPEHPHALTPERLMRYQKAASHPDEVDLRAVAQFAIKIREEFINKHH